MQVRSVNTIKKRLKYYSVTYLIAVISSMLGTGIPEWYYLIPIKVVAFCFMLFVGNSIYYISEENTPFLLASFRSLKYLLISMLLLLIFAWAQALLEMDLSALVGI